MKMLKIKEVFYLCLKEIVILSIVFSIAYAWREKITTKNNIPIEETVFFDQVVQQKIAQSLNFDLNDLKKYQDMKNSDKKELVKEVRKLGYLKNKYIVLDKGAIGEKGDIFDFAMRFFLLFSFSFACCFVFMISVFGKLSIGEVVRRSFYNGFALNKFLLIFFFGFNVFFPFDRNKYIVYPENPKPYFWERTTDSFVDNIVNLNRTF